MVPRALDGRQRAKYPDGLNVMRTDSNTAIGGTIVRIDSNTTLGGTLMVLYVHPRQPTGMNISQRIK